MHQKKLFEEFQQGHTTKMSNDQAKSVLAQALECELSSILDDSAFGVHPKWDSLAHMRLLIALETYHGLPITDESIQKLITVDAVQSAFQNRKT